MSMQPSLSLQVNLAADDEGATDEAAAEDEGAADELLLETGAFVGSGAGAGVPHATIKPSIATSATNNTNFRILSPP